MAHLDIKSILSLYASLYKDSPKERFLQEIAANKQEYNLTCALKLPALITKPDEVFAFFSSKVVPNFITQKLVIGEAIELDSTTQQNLQGSIVLIKSADPGYDYLFTKDIAGFITCYGGSNSHMAIRASELQIPAVIGVGEHAYQAYASATRIQLDCQAQRIVCL
ncbi:PEP-utilizing enzyme [Helicobacter canis]|nr:PEP-utilizing enzyme [Helicobacter canis]